MADYWLVTYPCGHENIVNAKMALPQKCSKCGRQRPQNAASMQRKPCTADGTPLDAEASTVTPQVQEGASTAPIVQEGSFTVTKPQEEAFTSPKSQDGSFAADRAREEAFTVSRTQRESQSFSEEETFSSRRRRNIVHHQEDGVAVLNTNHSMDANHPINANSLINEKKEGFADSVEKSSGKSYFLYCQGNRIEVPVRGGILGREEECLGHELFETNLLISRRHARVQNRESGLYIWDNNSMNGTYADIGQGRVRVSGEETVLHNGDRLWLANQLLVVWEE